MKTFNVFVYGTLMRGFRANSFIPSSANMVRGRIAGNLYHYIAGYPVVKILRHAQSVDGTGIAYDDIKMQEELNRVEPECLPFDLSYGRVHGELYQIPCKDNWGSVLMRLDSYEGFNPEAGDGSSLYNRTLVPVETDGGFVWAWVYNMDSIPSATVRIYSGDWRDCFYSNKGGLRPDVTRAIELNRGMEF